MPQELEVAAARAGFAAARLDLESQRLDPRSSLAEAQGTAGCPRLQAIAEGGGGAGRGVGAADLAFQFLAAQLGERVENRGAAARRARGAVHAQLQARQARLRQLERAHEEGRLAADSLQVKAGIDGVVQSVPVQEGQQLAPGANVARVAKPGNLYAELRIPEIDARDLAAGLPATIDMRDRLVRGRVDPRRGRGDRGRGEGGRSTSTNRCQNRRARTSRSTAPSRSRRWKGVRFVGRPMRAIPTPTKQRTGDLVAERVPVKFGKASVNQIVDLEGLEPGDIVGADDAGVGKDRVGPSTDNAAATERGHAGKSHDQPVGRHQGLLHDNPSGRSRSTASISTSGRGEYIRSPARPAAASRRCSRSSACSTRRRTESTAGGLRVAALDAKARAQVRNGRSDSSFRPSI